MKKTTIALCFVLTCLVSISAQNVETGAAGNARAQTSASAQESINIESGTRLAAELQKTIDVRKAKVGDEVVLKATKAIKAEGRTVVSKGARILGRVTEVAPGSGNGSSRIGILFDRLEHGSLAVPITATITSLTTASARASASNNDLFASDASARSTTTASSSSSSGGLLGNVGGVVNSTTSAVGATVNSTTNAVGNTATSVGRPLSGIQITQSSSTSAQGESVLSLQGGNLRLEKGTRFNLVLTQSANARTSPD